MRSKSIKEGPDRVFVLILDQGEDAFKAIADFANRERIDGASVTAIGAFSEAKVGWFDLAAKKYKPIAVKEQCEVLSLMGDIAQGDDGDASLHLHAVLVPHDRADLRSWEAATAGGQCDGGGTAATKAAGAARAFGFVVDR